MPWLALLMGAAAQKYKMFLCVQDLTCPGASLLHSASLSARIPTVAAIEGNARQYCRAFEDLFFEVLEQVILADGEVQPSEQFYLLKMIYSDRVIRDRERDFLVKLRQTATITTPDFEALCDEALTAHSTAWSVGGS